MAGEVEELFATLGLRVDRRSFTHGDRALDQTGKNADKLGDKADKAGKKVAGSGGSAAAAFAGVNRALALAGAYLGGRALYGKLIQFNAQAEESRNQIAGMLATTKKTDFNDELKTADGLLASLSKRAASLPGTTAEYVAMLGNITQPITDAGLGVKDLEDMTVAAVVAAKAYGEHADVAARDIGQALRGQFHADDPFLGKLLAPAGFKGEEGRQKFNAMSADQRAKVLKEALTSKQMMQMAEAQGDTFSGQLATFQDAFAKFFGMVGKPLFSALTQTLRNANKWIEANQERINALADAIGDALSQAFDALGVAVDYIIAGFEAFRSDSELVEAALITLGAVLTVFAAKAAAAWIAALGPVSVGIAAVVGLIYIIRKAQREPELVRRQFERLWNYVRRGAEWAWEGMRAVGRRIVAFFVEDIPGAIKRAFKAAFEYIAELPVIKQVMDAVSWARTLGDPVTSRQAQSTAKDLRSMGFRGAAQILERDAFAALTTMPDAPRQLTTGVPTAAALGSGVTIGAVNVGGINVTSPSADPKAVAQEAGRVFDEKLSAVLRQTGDGYQ